MTTTMAPQTTGTMKALVQEGDGSADVLHVRDVPRPDLAADRVLIKVRAASVNALDWHSVHGGPIITLASKIMRTKEQPVRGVDVAGSVEAVGENVTKFKPGDEVFGNAPASFAEYASGHKDGLALKPANVSFEQAAAVGVAGRTALQGLRDVAGVKPGQRVLIHGAGGGVGTFSVQIAKALGAHVTAVTGPTKVDIIRALGADEVIDYSKEDFTQRPARFDIVFDVAATRSIGSLRHVLVPGGMLVLVGASKQGGAAIFLRILNALVRSRMFKQQVKFFVAKQDPRDLPYLSGLMALGELTPRIDRTYPLSEAAEAVRYIGTGQARAKVVITMSW